MQMNGIPFLCISLHPAKKWGRCGGENFPTAESGTLGAIRTPDTLLRTEVFYPLNYEGTVKAYQC